MNKSSRDIRKLNLTRRLPSFLRRSAISLLRWRLEPEAKLPAPDLALRVGFTGPLYISDPKNLRDASRTVLRQIKESLEKQRSDYASALDAAPDVPAKLYLVSSLAAGADQIVARAALTEGYQLQSILPTGKEAFRNDIKNNCGARREASLKEVNDTAAKAVDEYLSLLSQSKSILEISDLDTPTLDQYRQAALAVLAHCDILLAVMDEKASSGITVQLVRSALEYGIPVVWIPLDFTLAAQLWRVNERERFTFGVDRLVASIVLEGAAPPTRKPGMLKRFADWFEEGYQRSMKLEYNNAEWERSWIPLNRLQTGSRSLDETRVAVARIFRPLAVWADYRAACFSSLYRGAFSFNALLGVISVFLALFGLIVPSLSWEAKAGELILLALMSGIFTLAHKRDWRDRWLSYRTLYQQTHHQAWRFLLGQTSPRRYDLDFGNIVRRGHSGFVLGALARSAGVPSGDSSGAHLQAFRHLVLRGLVRRQFRYFASESHSHVRAYERVEWRVKWCVYLASGFTFVYLMFEFTSRFVEILRPSVETMTPFAIFAGAFFPACAASLIAVANFEEHGQLGRRYSEITTILRRIWQTMAVLKPSPGRSHFDPYVLNRDNCSRLLDATMKAADEELVHWQLILITKDLERF